MLSDAPSSFVRRAGVALCCVNACDAVETLSIAYVLDDLKKEFSGLGVLAAALYIGMALGALVSGFLLERVGPRRLIVAMLRVEAAAGMLGAASSVVLAFLFCRFLSGFAIGALVPSLLGLASELFEPEERRVQWLVSITCSFLLGQVLAAVLACLTFEVFSAPWRLFYVLAGAVPLVVAQLVAHWVPESPQYLLRKRRHAELRQELSRTRVSDAGHIYLEGHDGLASGEHHADPVQCFHAATWWNLWSLPGRWDFVLLSVICFGIGFVWYGLSTWLFFIFHAVGVKNVYLAGIAFAASGLPGFALGTYAAQVCGKQRALASALAGTSVCCVLIAAMIDTRDGQVAMPPVLAALVVCLFSSVSSVAFNLLPTLWAQPFEHSVQGLGLGILSSWMRVGSMLAQLVDAALVSMHATEWMAYLASILMVLSASAACLLRRS